MSVKAANTYIVVEAGRQPIGTEKTEHTIIRLYTAKTICSFIALSVKCSELQQMALDLRIDRVCREDYPLLSLTRVFRNEFAQELFNRLEMLKWDYVDGGFYKQEERNLLEEPCFRSLFNKNMQGQLVEAASRMGRCDMHPFIEITAHRLVEGQYIGLHSDDNEIGESHRLVMTLNKGWNVSEGGALMFYQRKNARGLIGAWLPQFNHGHFFEIHPSSYHAVAEPIGRRRMSVVFTFHRRYPRSREKPLNASWLPAPSNADLECCRSTAFHHGIDMTFDGPYKWMEFTSVRELHRYFGRVINVPPRFSYLRAPWSSNVDEHGRQPKGSDQQRITYVGRLTLIPPIIVLKDGKKRACLVDGSHRLSYAVEAGLSAGVAIFSTTQIWRRFARPRRDVD